MIYSVEEVAAMIEKGDTLLLAGDANLLSQLPKGNWIAGATSRFVEAGKGLVNDRNGIFVHNMTDIADDTKIQVYDASNICNIYDDAFDNGFSVMIVPSFSEGIKEYSIHCSEYSNFAHRPVCGWNAVTSLYSDYERNDESLVFSGESDAPYTQECIVMHIGLPDDKYAEIHVFSPFKPEGDDVIIFEENGQRFENVFINGNKMNFRQFLIDQQIDRTHDSSIISRKCLAGDYGGFLMNVAIASETEGDLEKYVTLGAPVYKNIPYRLANMDNIAYERMKKQFDGELVYSFTCVNNHARPEIFQKYLTQMNGPLVYGEIAYYPMSNATVYITVGNVSN